MGEVRSRWLHLTLALVLVLLLGPTPRPAALAERIVEAAAALRGLRGQQALPLSEQAVLLAPEQPELRLLAARAALAAEQPQRALRLLEQAREAGAASAESACLEAETQLAAGRTQPALDLLSGPCRPSPELLQRLSKRLSAEGKWEPAELVAAQWTGLEPGSAAAHARLGLLIALRDPAAALGELRLASALDPNGSALPGQLVRAIEAGQALGSPAMSLAQVGQTLAAAQEWNLAQRALERSLELDPEAPGALALLGIARDQTGEDGSAQLLAAAELAPESAQIQLLLARHRRGRGELELALAALEAAARLDPSDPVIAGELGSLYLALGKPQLAEGAYLHAVTVAPQDPFFWGLLARFSLEQELSLTTLGLPAARAALRLDPDDPQAMDLLAACHYLLGDMRLAERLLWRALALDPRLASAHYHRGLVQLALGELQGAVLSFQRAQSLDPQGRVGDLATRSLSNLGR